MKVKQSLSEIVVILLLIIFACNGQQQQQQQDARRPPARPAAVSVAPPAVASSSTNRQEVTATGGTGGGSNFDQERLIALFGSNAQPVYGNRDPTTGRVVMMSSETPHAAPALRPLPPPPPPSRRLVATAAALLPSPSDSSLELDQEEEEEEEEGEGVEIDRKDTRVPETNEINPFELLPPQFHDLLNIPIHDYGNGTTYNPYDKYKVPSKIKYPLVSTGYANTKYQGSPSSTTTRKPPPPLVKAKQPPAPQVSTGDYEDYDDDYDGYKPTQQQTHRPITAAKRPPPPPPPAATYKPKPKISSTTTESPGYYDADYDEFTNKNHRTASPPVNNKRIPSSVYQYQRPPFRPENAETPEQQQRPHEPFKSGDNKSKRPTGPPPSIEHQRPHSGFRPSNFGSDSFEAIHEQQQNNFNKQKPFHAEEGGADDFDKYVEIKVTPKPFYAADDNQNYYRDGNEDEQPHPHPQAVGHVDDASVDIIYDYDDERSKGEGVIFMIDNKPGVSGVGATGPPPSSPQGGQFQVSNSRPPPSPVPTATSNPLIKKNPYPTVANRERVQQQQQASPAFRPSAPLRTGNTPAEVKQDIFLPGSSHQPQQSQQQLPGLNSLPPLPSANQQQNSFGDSPRPPFRFTPPNHDIVQQQQPTIVTNENQQAPNILPLFRPNANPTEEFQFIKHPQSIQLELQRQQQQQQPAVGPPPGATHFRPNDGGPPLRNRPNVGGPMSPLSSALQTPFSSISQAVANFFGRRSGIAATADSEGHPRSNSPGMEQARKMDRSGMAAGADGPEDDEEEEEEEELEMAESRPFVLFSRPDTPLLPPRSPAPAAISIDRSSEMLPNLHPQQQQPQPPLPIIGLDPTTGKSQQVMGIRANPEASDTKPPAFYVYTTRELAEGKPPYLVVGPVLSGPPNVAGAQLVHTAPAHAMSMQTNPLEVPTAQRRNDFPSNEGEFPTVNTRPTSPNALPSQFPPSFLPPPTAVNPPPPPPPQIPFQPQQQQQQQPAAAKPHEEESEDDDDDEEPEPIQFQSAPVVPTVRKPFFPIASPSNGGGSSGSNKKKVNRPSNGLSPPPPGVQQPQQQQQVRPASAPAFTFPFAALGSEDLLEQSINGNPHPQGIAPIGQGIAPPRVPLNPQKDVASLFSNPTLLHTRPGFFGEPVVEPVGSSSVVELDHHSTDQGFAIESQAQENIQPHVSLFDSQQFLLAQQQQHQTISPGVHSAPMPHPSLFAAAPSPTTTPKPLPLNRKPTKPTATTTTSTTTPASVVPYVHSFSQEQPVTYSTIQKEDGNKIAVVHPAYIVTYKNKPPPPSLEYLQAPFIPSVESGAIEEGEEIGELESASGIDHHQENWHFSGQHNSNPPDSLPDSSSSVINISHGPINNSNNNNKQKENANLNYESGFYPIVPVPTLQ